ncbi:MAG: 50S ribosomal protein L10 [Bacteroidetes bacterium]|nr:50S ribosomal protein L10 [Bacteroidota bacterium]
MKKEEKNQIIDSLVEQLNTNNNFYLTDTSGLNVEITNKLRRLCFKRNVKLLVVKNTLLKKAMERTNKDFDSLYDSLEGATSIMFSDSGNVPAKLIKEFRKTAPKPIIKAAFAEESCFVGENLLEVLINIKSKKELVADIIYMLQSPAKNVISALQSSSHKIAGIVKTLSEKN